MLASENRLARISLQSGGRLPERRGLGREAATPHGPYLNTSEASARERKSDPSFKVGLVTELGQKAGLDNSGPVDTIEKHIRVTANGFTLFSSARPYSNRSMSATFHPWPDSLGERSRRHHDVQHRQLKVRTPAEWAQGRFVPISVGFAVANRERLRKMAIASSA